MRRVILILCNIALLSIAVNSATPLAQILGKVDDNRIDSFHPIVKRNLSHNVLQTKEENRVNDKRKVRVHRGKAKKDKKHGKKGKGKKADNIANKKSGKGKKKNSTIHNGTGKKETACLQSSTGITGSTKDHYVDYIHQYDEHIEYEITELHGKGKGKKYANKKDKKKNKGKGKGQSSKKGKGTKPCMLMDESINPTTLIPSAISSDDRSFPTFTPTAYLQTTFEPSSSTLSAIPINAPNKEPSTNKSQMPSSILTVDHFPSVTPSLPKVPGLNATFYSVQPSISNSPSTTQSPSASMSSNQSNSHIPTISKDPSIAPILPNTMTNLSLSLAPSGNPIISNNPSSAATLLSQIPTSNATNSSSPVPSSQGNKTLTNSSCQKLSPEERCLAIKQIILDGNITSANDIVSPPQSSALDWICNSDGHDVCPGDGFCAMEQRYIMAVFYFATGGDGWNNCAARDMVTNSSVCDAITDLQQPGYNPSGSFAWLDPVDECEWFGLRCILGGDECIRIIQLEGIEQSGFIPSEMTKLFELRFAALENGDIGGTIPETINHLQNLRLLDIDAQSLVGAIPESLFDLTNLETLDINENNLSGTISASIGDLTGLVFLQVDRNNFNGTIPDTFTNMTNLVDATFENNNFSGTVPPSLCNLRTFTLQADCAQCAPSSCCTSCQP